MPWLPEGKGLSVAQCIYLHEEARDEGFPNVEVVVLAGELCACSAQVEAVHNARQLLTDVVGRLQRTEAHKVIVAPLVLLTV